jgi:hypothetical protein
MRSGIPLEIKKISQLRVGDEYIDLETNTRYMVRGVRPSTPNGQEDGWTFEAEVIF